MTSRTKEWAKSVFLNSLYIMRDQGVITQTDVKEISDQLENRIKEEKFFNNVKAEQEKRQEQKSYEGVDLNAN